MSSSPRKIIKLPYKINFQPQYIDISQTTTKLLKQKEKQILKGNKEKTPVGQINNQLYQLTDNIQQSGLLFVSQEIYFQFASNKQSEEKMKSRSQMCLLCGNQMKKIVQCQLCAEAYCKDCCWRKRVIPGLNDKQPKNSCQNCHRKYIKLFNDQGFNQQKQLLFKIIDATRKKIQKTNQKASQRQKVLSSYNIQKRNDKIKEGNLNRKIEEQEKKLRQVEEQLRKIVMQRAQKIRKEQQKNEKIRKQQQQQKQKRQKQRQAIRLKEEKLKKQEEELSKIRQKNKEQEKQLLKKKKQQEQNIKKLQNDKINLKERQKQLQIKIKINQQKKQEEKQALLRSIAQQDHNEKENLQSNSNSQNILFPLSLGQKISQQKSTTEQAQILSPKIKQQTSFENKVPRKNNSPTSKSTASMGSQKQSKQSLQNQNQKFENKAINPNQMSINDILNVIIPVRPQQQGYPLKSPMRLSKRQSRQSVSSQLDVECDASPLKATKQNQQNLQKLRKTLNEPELQEEDMSIDKAKRRQSLLREGSLMSSTKTNPNESNQNQEQIMDPDNKCSCQIM